MTKLTITVKREVASSHGALVIEVGPEGLTLRAKRTRTKYGPLPYGWLFLQAAKKTADAKLAEKRKAKKGGKAKAKRGLLST